MNGNKLFDFRKVRCREDVDKIIIYATSPVMQVVGEAQVMEIIVDEPEQVWQITSEYAGITKVFYDQYFHNKERAVAYRLGNVKKYSKPRSLSDFGLNFEPQSFVYV
ncbi:50S ribosomal protein L22/unknown domain fusion protein [Pelotomaculum sp. FP]|uniref:hypothetical protein n=1 Tax=Pelotomaculum sp. FP TaxID=261474 RepID=UPI0010FFD861|nr:hypothetical protein [Pelotomaculum sp. FP]TEB12168.1 50S ribosomal protein L22/unknown domain fusion protein [Pelotomaculum sp. FP]